MTPTQSTLAHMQSLGEEKAAQFYNKSITGIRTALRTKKITAKDIDHYFNALENPAEPTVENKTYVTTANYEGLDYAEVHGKLDDLNARTSELESQMSTVLAQLAASSVQPTSSIRPQGQIYGSIPQPIRPADAPPEYQGVQPGMAPTMQEARRSAMGAKGPPAQPAQPRMRQPGDPGTYGWNDTKDQRKIKQQLAFEAEKQRLLNQRG